MKHAKYFLSFLLILISCCSLTYITQTSSPELESFTLSVSDDNLTSPEALNAQYHLDSIGFKNISEYINNYHINENIVAVIDTGCDLSHEDISENLWTNDAEANGTSGVDDDNNGYVDDIHGINLIYPSSQPEDDTDNSHGTHVAGIIGMLNNNSVGYSGINFNTKIMIIKAGNSNNSFTYANCIKAIDYAIANGADVINLSLGSKKTDDSFASKLEEASKQCIITSAAGNAGERTSVSPYYPAAYPYVIGIMSSTTDNMLAAFSNWNDTEYTYYDIICPGENILSTITYNGYNKKTGTSMSSPMVAGACSILYGLLEANKEYVSREALINDVKYYLFKGTLPFTHTSDNKSYTYPHLNITGSIKSLIYDLDNPEATVSPTAGPSSTPAPSAKPTPTNEPAPTNSPAPTVTTVPTITPVPVTPPAPSMFPVQDSSPTPTVAPVSTAAPVTHIKKPANISGVKKVKLSNKKIKIRWKKKSGISGYQIKIYKKNKDIIWKTTSKNSVTLKYKPIKYIKVRAYKKMNHKKIYGSYKKIKI